jgi:nucleotide-binding universal stress UspA family protein
MTLKTILLQLTDNSANDNSIDVAVSLAKKHDAYINAIYAIAPVHTPAAFMGYVPPEFIEQSRQQADADAVKMITQFSSVANNSGVSFNASKTEGYPLDALSNAALSCDLLVCGQVDPDGTSKDIAHNLVGDLVVTSPAPVLVTPYIGSYTDFGKHILVGWNATRESSRAIHAALPFLKSAEKVTLLSVNPTSDQTAADSAIRDYLTRHGVTATLNTGQWQDVSAGNALLDSLVDLNADMIVMGAYGHSRIREMILGGVTQEILEQMTAPVLFAH